MLINNQFNRNSISSIQSSQEEELDIPIKKNDSIQQKNKTKACQNHPSKQISYFNITFLKKLPQQFPKTVFLCQECAQDLKLKFQNKPTFLRYLFKIQDFKEKYINSIMKKYAQETNQVQRKKNNNLLQQYETDFINYLQDKKQSIIKTLTDSIEQFKQTIKNVFTTLRIPRNPQKQKLFQAKQYSNDLIQYFYKNFNKVQNYKGLISPKNRQILIESLSGVKQLLNNQSLILLKQRFNMAKQGFLKHLKGNKSIYTEENFKINEPKQFQKEKIQINKKKTQNIQANKRQQQKNKRQEQKTEKSNHTQKSKSMVNQIQKQPIKNQARKEQKNSKPKFMEQRERSRQNNKNINNKKIQVNLKDKFEIIFLKSPYERPAKIQYIEAINQILRNVDGKISIVEIDYVIHKANNLVPLQVKHLPKAQFVIRYPLAYSIFRKKSDKK